MSLLSIQESELTSENLAQYRRDGFLHIKNVIDQSHIEILRSVVNQQASEIKTTKTGYDFESLSRQLWTLSLIHI